MQSCVDISGRLELKCYGEVSRKSPIEIVNAACSLDDTWHIPSPESSFELTNRLVEFPSDHVTVIGQVGAGRRTLVKHIAHSDPIRSVFPGGIVLFPGVLSNTDLPAVLKYMKSKCASGRILVILSDSSTFARQLATESRLSELCVTIVAILSPEAPPFNWFSLDLPSLSVSQACVMLAS
eukprot:TRINITY_DN6159_c0_g2_i1.p1 TRINITY_DN6159_c0_g2~~TRINITY_DN6159_c0_g2_i1.p1  ORF type:complete len:180 (+),score=17.02 TRINITY_DN6159_c0_g2_i1:234-773(+)